MIVTQNTAKLFRLNEMSTEEPMPGFGRKRIIGENVMVSVMTVARGCEVPWHRHVNEQIVVLLEGHLQFDVELADGQRQRFELRSGDALLLPGNVAHGGLALEDCRAIDVFSPPSATTGIDVQANRKP